ncbi:MBL fold metallo-hydrolase [Cohnella sp. REN36]|uniref:MBL fold metallo-hydrolase n=1 Tax=Cohnella sp. REN36 TaxID=2887347 RepID=UPI001D14C36A|nr:MBL fold metallo-hydrolase [Cohnella sp. REN36]MCC3375711.1 MBL fold metallo-hydrolase [Cohnella sp. REN36]
MSEAGTWTRHENGWVQLRVPLPFSLKWVNSYVLPDGAGYSVVDPGLRSADAEACWEAALGALGIGWRDVTGIVLTHHHPDHYGLSGWMQERTGASVYLSAEARVYAEKLWGEGETFSDELIAAFRSYGLPEKLVPAMQAHLEGVKAQVNPPPREVRLVEAGAPLAFGGASWTPIAGEGHAPGHLSYYDEARGLLLCGDQVLPDITPNIGWMPDADPDPLGAFLDSLEALRPLEVARAYPGHRDPFDRFGERVEAIVAHHERRLRRMAELAAEAGEPLSAFEMCERLFGARLQGNAHNLRFAMAETIAHLVRLERSGRVERVEESADGAVRQAVGKPLIRFRPSEDMRQAVGTKADGTTA